MASSAKLTPFDSGDRHGSPAERQAGLNQKARTFVWRRGSRATLSPSPTMFAAITVSVIAKPGKTAAHQATRING